MTKSIESLADILAPVTPEAFFADIRYQKPLHIKGDPEKFARVMSWPTLTELVNQTSIWSAQTLQPMLDPRRIEPDRKSTRLNSSHSSASRMPSSHAKKKNTHKIKRT